MILPTIEYPILFTQWKYHIIDGYVGMCVWRYVSMNDKGIHKRKEYIIKVLPWKFLAMVFEMKESSNFILKF
jgi:hypothetical protein